MDSLLPYPCNAGDLGSIPGLGRSPGEGKGYPLKCSGLENSTDCIVYGVTKSRTQLSNFHFHCPKEPHWKAAEISIQAFTSPTLLQAIRYQHSLRSTMRRIHLKKKKALCQRLNCELKVFSINDPKYKKDNSEGKRVFLFLSNVFIR